MSYTPTTWNTGDTISASAMNKIENGIANAGGALICNDNVGELDKTVEEIYNAFISGMPVYIKYNYGTLGVSGTGTYTSYAVLAPVIAIASYGYTSVIRITASKPLRVNYENDYYNYVNGMITYSATSMNSYPEYIRGTATASTAIQSNNLGGLT